MSRRSIACLAGAGVGPELMAQTTRALTEVTRLHGVGLDDVHVPFGGEAVTRCGHPLPQATRNAYRTVEAILVASPHEPALEGVKADVDPTWRVACVHKPAGGDVLVFGPVGPFAEANAVTRAFEAAAARRGRLTCVGGSTFWRGVIDAEVESWGGMEVERATLGEVLVRLRDEPQRLDVVVAEANLAVALADAASHLFGTKSTTAFGWLSDHGPGVFVPEASESADMAGFGVVNPAGMLLTAALLLGEGLGQRAAARTLQRAVAGVTSRNGSAPRGTREFTDAVIALLPSARTDTELFEEAWA